MCICGKRAIQQDRTSTATESLWNNVAFYWSEPTDSHVVASHMNEPFQKDAAQNLNEPGPKEALHPVTMSHIPR